MSSSLVFPYKYESLNIRNITPRLNKSYFLLKNNSSQLCKRQHSAISIPVNYNSSMIETTKKIRNIERVKVLGDLKGNWNDNGALPFPKSLLDIGVSIIRNIIIQPKVFPTARQSIQLEYEKVNGDYLELEVFVEKIEFFMERSNGEEKEGSIPYNIQSINKAVADFYGTDY